MNYLSIIGAAAIGAVIAWFVIPDHTPHPPELPPIISLQPMAKLASLTVNYANVIKTEIPKKILNRWQIGATDALLVARGSCIIGTDLKLAKYDNPNPSNKTVELLLPMPSEISGGGVSHAKSEEGGSYIYLVSSKGLAPFSSNDKVAAVEAAYAKAEEEIKSSCKDKAAIDAAKNSAVLALRPTFDAVGWQANIHWY